MRGRRNNLGFACDIKGQTDANNGEIIGGKHEFGKKPIHNDIGFLFGEENREKQIVRGQSVCFCPMYVW